MSPAATISVHAAEGKRVIVPIFVESAPAGEFPLWLGAPVDVSSLETKTLAPALEPYLQESVLARLKSSPQTTLKELRDLGLQADFDEATITVRISVPTDLRRQLEINLGEKPPIEVYAPPGTADPISRPATFSFFSNFFGSQPFGKRVGSGFAREPSSIDEDFGVQYRKWVLEGSSSFRERADHPFTRHDVRVVHDFPAQMARLNVGDQTYSVTGFQNFRPLGGIGAGSRFETQPHRLTYPTRLQEIALREPATVNVYVNDRLVRTLELPSGRYRLTDLPMVVGRNDIRYEIVAKSGKIETVSAQVNHDPEQLAKGIQHFSYSFGFPSEQAGWNYRYDAERLTVSAFHRIGLFESLTGGLNFQGDKSQILAGTEALLSTWIGVLSNETALGAVLDRSQTGFANRLRWIRSDAHSGGDGGQRTWSLGYEIRTPHFASLGENADSQAIAHELTAQFSDDLFAGWSAGLALSRTFRRLRPEAPFHAYRASLTLAQRWTSTLFSSVIGTYGRDATGALDRTVLVLLSWSPGEGRDLFNGTADSSTPSLRADWRHRSPARSEKIEYGAGIERRPGSATTGLGQVDYTGNRARASLSTQGDATPEGFAHRTDLRASTALVFADGKLALSRPVMDSFAIVASESPKDAEVALNPGPEDSHESRSDFLGPAVLSDLASYNRRTALVDTSRLPAHVAFERNQLAFEPTYKSGASVRIGVRRSGWARATVVDPDGKPLALAAGRVQPGAVEIFTDRKGRVHFEVNRAGEYRLEMGSKTSKFTVPENFTEGVELGTLRLER